MRSTENVHFLIDLFQSHYQRRNALTAQAVIETRETSFFSGARSCQTFYHIRDIPHKLCVSCVLGLSYRATSQPVLRYILLSCFPFIGAHILHALPCARMRLTVLQLLPDMLLHLLISRCSQLYLFLLSILIVLSHPVQLGQARDPPDCTSLLSALHESQTQSEKACCSPSSVIPPHFFCVIPLQSSIFLIFPECFFLCAFRLWSLCFLRHCSLSWLYLLSSPYVPDTP